MIERDTLVIVKSTVPVGTNDQVRAVLAEVLKSRGVDYKVTTASNPEFLKEGFAVDDFMRPDRVVVGVDDEESAETLRELYLPFNRNRDRLQLMDVRSAEFTKYAANAMLAVRISFMNEMANLADRLGVDIEHVRKGIGSDPRIGFSFLYAGTGYGGSCFPKDVQALVRSAGEFGQHLEILHAVESVNNQQKQILLGKITARLGEDLSGKTFAMWGLAFKPNTDDMRAAPSRVMVKELLKRGAKVVAFDPVSMEEARHAFELDLADLPADQRGLSYSDAPMSAVDGADALIIMTEWKAFKSPDFGALKAALSQPLIFDGRNLYEPATMRKEGVEYHAIGRAGKHAG
jgi:UDPglucose 6-dehydrogenase